MALLLTTQSTLRSCLAAVRIQWPFGVRNHWRFIAIHSHSQHAIVLSSIQSKVDVSSSQFRRNAEAMDAAITVLKEKHARIQEGGPAKAREKHLAKGKMLPRE